MYKAFVCNHTPEFLKYPAMNKGEGETGRRGEGVQRGHKRGVVLFVSVVDGFPRIP